MCEDSSDWHKFECEFGPGVNGDGCNVYCEIEVGWFCLSGMPGTSDFCFTTCGDGRVLNNEACDDGNANNGLMVATTDGCANCAIVNGWYCWNGSPYTRSYCAEICGDGIDFKYFPCDDGNLKNDDGCD